MHDLEKIRNDFRFRYGSSHQRVIPIAAYPEYKKYAAEVEQKFAVARAMFLINYAFWMQGDEDDQTGVVLNAISPPSESDDGENYDDE